MLVSSLWERHEDLRVLLFAVLTISAAIAQQDQSQGSAPESAAQAAAKKDKKQPATTSAQLR